MKVCKTCNTPTKCKAAGKCQKRKKPRTKTPTY